VPAISVGSVEVDVVPSARGVRQHLQRQLLPAADEVGDELGRIVGRYVMAGIARGVIDGVQRGGRQAQAPAARQGQASGSAFARSFRTSVEGALRDLPDVEINADSSDVDREIAHIRAQLETLRDSTIGVDIDAGEATARIERLQERLQRLQASDADVNVRLDAGAASSQLAAFQAMVNRLDGQTANVDVDTRSAAANLNLLTTAALAFGPAIIPVLPVVAAGLGAIAAAGVAAAAGVGAVALVAVPAFKQIGTTLQAQKAAQDAASQASARGGQAAAQAASRSMQLASAAQSVASAERNGAKQVAAAQQQVSQARRSAAQTAAQASLRSQQAARAVQDAEKALAGVQRDARKAQEDLTAARRTAAQELADLNSRLTDSVLSQRDAEIGLKEATLERDKVLKAQTSTELDKQKALLTYDQAVQRLKEQTTETSRLKDETQKANKAGVDGSQTVKSAQEQLAAAQDAVADKTRALSDVQADQARTATQNASDIADAQQRIAQAQTAVGDAQIQAAESAASAQRQLAQAQMQTTGGVDQAAVAQAKYRAELAKLTPAARGTMDAYVGLQTAFSAWSKALQPAVMPIFTRALIGLKNSLPGITPFVLAAADAIGVLQDKASAELKKPFWRGFKADLQGNVKPAIIGLGVAFGNVLKGMAGLVDGFLPHMDDISATMQRITGKFSAWATGLRGSPEFERFLSYSSEHAPMIAETLGKIATAFLNIGTALSPLSGPLLAVIGGLASGVGWLAQNVPGLVIGIYGLYVATKLWAAWQLIANGALLAFQLISAAGPWGWIVLGIAAVVLAVITMYQHFGWFRDGVKAVFSAVQTAAMWLWTNALKPTFAAIWEGLQTVGRWAMWLWENAIKPAWDAISLAARILLTAIVVAAILPIIVAFKVLGAIAGWLWTNAIRPAFKAIAAIAVWLYRNMIKPQFDAMVAAFRVVAKIAMWLWRNALAPAFRAIGDAAKSMYMSAIKPAFGWIADRAAWAWDKVKFAFDLLKGGLKAVGAAFKTAKDYIGEQWGKVSGLAKKPVQFIIDTVYNNGIRGVWNKVASAFGAPPLDKFTFARGGVMPGYTPGKDVHRFVSPTGGALELSGGEAIMRPEFTRAVGSGFVNSMNALARSRGAQGIKAALAPAFGGNPRTSTDTTLRYADGGIFGWIGNAASKVAGAGSAAWNGIKKGASWLKDTLEASARAGVRNVVDPLLRSFPGMDTGFGKLVRSIPNSIVDALFGYSKEADKKGGGGVGGPKVQGALRWAKAQAGKPYLWGGVGPTGFDCSGFMGAIENVLRGQKPNSRRWATGAFSGNTAPPGWVKNGNSPFRVGITNAGVGHTAGTLGKTKVESRGGAGVVVGAQARGYNDRLFPDWYGFQPGKYDSGGYLQPGLNLAYNGTGRPEPVFTAAQSNALTSMAGRGGSSGPASFRGDLYLDSGEFLGKVRGEATQVMQQGQQQLISVLNAN
jgi:hypothetical protein